MSCSAPDGFYSGLIENLSGSSLADWGLQAVTRAEAYMQAPNHGDYRRWIHALENLPRVGYRAEIDQPVVDLGNAAENSGRLADALQQFHPWRKGPFRLGGVYIDSEWRSDWKWNRVSDEIDLGNHKVLDVGCGNGYFGWRMLAEGADLVVGIDPGLVYVMQWLVCRHFAGPEPNFVLPLKLQDLPRNLHGFDTVFSMGVMYHRKSPLDHLAHLHSLLKPGGRLVLETLVVEGGANKVLEPRGRYARMRNVWKIPSVETLKSWLKFKGFRDVRVLDETVTGTDEQRSTDWMRFESLAKCLNEDNPGLTVEGYPAPRRAVLTSRCG